MIEFFETDTKLEITALSATLAELSTEANFDIPGFCRGLDLNN